MARNIVWNDKRVRANDAPILKPRPLELREAFASNRRTLAIAKSFVEPLEQILRGLGDDGAGREYRVRARLAEGNEVLGRDDAADDDHRIIKPQLTESFFQSRHQREVAGGQRRHSNDMHLPFGRASRHFFRRREQGSDLDVKAKICER